MNEPKEQNHHDDPVIVELKQSRMRKGGINPLPLIPSPPPPAPQPQTPAEQLFKQGLSPQSQESGEPNKDDDGTGSAN